MWTVSCPHPLQVQAQAALALEVVVVHHEQHRPRGLANHLHAWRAGKLQPWE